MAGGDALSAVVEVRLAASPCPGSALSTRTKPVLLGLLGSGVEDKVGGENNLRDGSPGGSDTDHPDVAHQEDDEDDGPSDS